MSISPTRRTYRTVAAFAAAGVLSLGLAACHGKSTADGGAKSSSSAGGPATASATVDVKNFAFTPSTVTVKQGGTVTWKFEDPVDHNVDFNGKTSPNYDDGKTYSMKFNTPGTYNYICGIHNYMTGKVVVK